MKPKKSRKTKVNLTLNGWRESSNGRKLLVGGVLAGVGYAIYRGIRVFMTEGPAKIAEKQKKTPQATKIYAPVPPKGNDQFPLKIGSEGARIVKVQAAVDKLGGKITIDGNFGLDTAQKLNTLGFPAVMDENTYNRLLSKAGMSTLDIVFNPQSVSQELHAAAGAGNISLAQTALRKIKDVQGYESVKNEFIKKPVSNGLRTIRVTSLVNGLLEVAFRGNEAAGKLIADEFFRMGLKQNPQTKVWSLTGLMTNKATVYAITDTSVTDALNNRSKVPAGTKLGRLVNVRNNIVFYRDSTQQMKSVPYNTIRYEI